jgi:hypothetical protein
MPRANGKNIDVIGMFSVYAELVEVFRTVCLQTASHLLASIIDVVRPDE